ncbi:peptidyl-prolyl cis-trans isomerase FKBP8-like isoform X2 [Amphiura filiformis]
MTETEGGQQAVEDLITGEEPESCKMKENKSLTNGSNGDDVETTGVQENDVSASGDAPVAGAASKEDLAVPQEVEHGEDTDGKINSEMTQDEETRTHNDEPSESKEDEDGDKKEEKEDEDPDWVDILGTGHLKKKVLREGQGMDTRPERGQLVTIRSKGQLPSGDEVDCYEEIQFVLGDGDVVQAWDLAVALMQLGEQALVITKPRFGYGEEGRNDDIPPNTDLTYELELLKVEEKLNIETLSPDECCQMADKKRERGNELYSRKDYSNAINSYSKALEILRDIKPSSYTEDSKKTVDELKVKCYNNLAAAQLKVDAPNAALKSCNSVLDIRPKNVKALFRKGKVLAVESEFQAAVAVMKEALALEPSNKTIHQELSKLTARQAEEKQSEKELYQRMVGDMAKVTEIPEDHSKRQWMYAISVGILAVAIFVGAIIASQA